MIICAACVAVCTLFVNSKSIEPKTVTKTITADTAVITYPKQVKVVIDAKCYKCHSPEGRSEKAKQKLLWDELPKLEKAKQLAKLDEIIESIEKGSMPPERLVQQHPEAALTKEEARLLKEWADGAAEELMK